MSAIADLHRRVDAAKGMKKRYVEYARVSDMEDVLAEHEDLREELRGLMDSLDDSVTHEQIHAALLKAYQESA